MPQHPVISLDLTHRRIGGEAGTEVKVLIAVGAMMSSSLSCMRYTRSAMAPFEARWRQKGVRLDDFLSLTKLETGDHTGS